MTMPEKVTTAEITLEGNLTAGCFHVFPALQRSTYFYDTAAKEHDCSKYDTIEICKY
jgi:hypothetical protein